MNERERTIAMIQTCAMGQGQMKSSFGVTVIRRLLTPAEWAAESQAIERDVSGNGRDLVLTNSVEFDGSGAASVNIPSPMTEQEAHDLGLTRVPCEGETCRFCRDDLGPV